MYRSFTVENYRGFGSLTLEGLQRINLMSGKNNVGKTALLEAIFLSGSCSPQIAQYVDAFRGMQVARVEFGPHKEPPWVTLFRNFNLERPIVFRGTWVSSDPESADLPAQEEERVVQLIPSTVEELPRISPVPLQSEGASIPPSITSAYPYSGYAHVLKLSYKMNGKSGEHFLVMQPVPAPPLTYSISIEPPPPPPPFQTIYISASHISHLEDDARRFSKLQLEKRDNEVIDALKIIEPHLESLRLVVMNGVTMLHGDIGRDQLIPIPLMGAGMARIASMVLAITEASGGVLVIDEIENGLHHSVLEKFWEVMGRTAKKYNVQIFATTHSMECIKAAYRAFMQEARQDFKLYRIDRQENDFHVVAYDQDTLKAAIEMQLEVRA